MKALKYHCYGRAEEVLQLEDHEPISPSSGEVKVKMLYSPINNSDLTNFIEGIYSNALSRVIWNYHQVPENFSMDPSGTKFMPALPHTPGMEGVGVVVEAGPGLYGRFLIGKRVAVVSPPQGNWQQFNTTSTKNVFPILSGISDEQAAVAFVNPLTAYILIKHILKIKKGGVLLQSAGNSEIAKMVSRMGQHFGFTTINIIRNESQRSKLLALGANYVINSQTEDLRQRVYDITKGQGVGYALDSVSGETPAQMALCLGLKGKLVLYGTLTFDAVNINSRDLMTPNASIEGFFLPNWMSNQSIITKLLTLRGTMSLIKKGVLSSDIEQIVALEDYKQALEAVRQSDNRGKILLRLND